MMGSFRQPLLEAALIFVASVLLGFTYSTFAGKGLFAPSNDDTERVTLPGDTSFIFITYEQGITGRRQAGTFVFAICQMYKKLLY